MNIISSAEQTFEVLNKLRAAATHLRVTFSVVGVSFWFIGTVVRCDRFLLEFKPVDADGELTVQHLGADSFEGWVEVNAAELMISRFAGKPIAEFRLHVETALGGLESVPEPTVQ